MLKKGLRPIIFPEGAPVKPNKGGVKFYNRKQPNNLFFFFFLILHHKTTKKGQIFTIELKTTLLGDPVLNWVFITCI